MGTLEPNKDDVTVLRENLVQSPYEYKVLRLLEEIRVLLDKILEK
jgi:hypothetical protein